MRRVYPRDVFPSAWIKLDELASNGVLFSSEQVFEELGGNVRAMAKHFSRDRRQIYRWLEAYGLKERRKAKKGK